MVTLTPNSFLAMKVEAALLGKTYIHFAFRGPGWAGLSTSVANVKWEDLDFYHKHGYILDAVTYSDHV